MPRMDWALGGVGVVLLVIGLVGQGFEMRRINAAADGTESPSPPNVFADRRNYKWYAMIVAGIVLWFAAERL